MTRIHISFTTGDLAATTAFYAALFDAAPDKERDGYARFQPDGVPITLSLMPGPVDTLDSDSHFGIKLQNQGEVAAAQARLRTLGLEQLVEDNVTCCWAVQDKVWVTDPDGRPWEVYVVTDDLPAKARDEDLACCGPEVSNNAQASCCP